MTASIPFDISLNNRQQRVLQATVRQYIATARPVGSEALVQELKPRVSPATIRNVMGHLEKTGLLYQPHTSAGRVPSDNGYRVYVDHLVTPSRRLAKQVTQVLSQHLEVEGYSLDTVLRGAAQILAALSGYITLVTIPQTTSAQLRYLQLMLVDVDRALMVVVLESYETQSILVDLPGSAEDESVDRDLLERELQVLSNFLNQHLVGRSLSTLNTLNWSELGQQFERYADLLRKSLADLDRRARDSTASQMFVTGVAEVLRRQPEFAELHQVQPIVHLLEAEPDQICALIVDVGEPRGDRRVNIRIGTENPLEPMQGCTLISATYQCGESATGSVGMLGPTRMVYEDAIALVETTATHLTEALS